MTKVGTWELGRRLAAPAVPASLVPSVEIHGVQWSGAARLVKRITLALLVTFVLMLFGAVIPGLVGYPTLTVSGGSMGASLPQGSVAVARWVQPDEVRVGYVILMGRGDDAVSPRVHRVVSLEEEDGYIVAQTKGDANDDVDPGTYVFDERVAVHTYTIPYVGYVIDFVRTPLGWLLIVALPATILCAFTLRDIWSVGGTDRVAGG